jgi:hypothetical protein
MKEILNPNLTETEVLLQTYQDHLKSWKKTIIASQDGLPILAFESPIIGSESFWSMGGIHGEEPATGEAFAKEIDTIANLKIPFVFLPMLNPKARQLGQRFYGDSSVTDCEYLLKGGQPKSKITEDIMNWIIPKMKEKPPLLTIDHHEDDEEIGSNYIYLSGNNPKRLEMAKIVVKALGAGGEARLTRFGEEIENGIVFDTHDDSIDDFLSTKNPNNIGIVLETKAGNLRDRVNKHRRVIRLYDNLWNTLIKP